MSILGTNPAIEFGSIFSIDWWQRGERLGTGTAVFNERIEQRIPRHAMLLADHDNFPYRASYSLRVLAIIRHNV